ncbi:MAG: ABC transporter substrate-binding protein [Meiothermus sp.]|nr:ABC transporter substrate-binding protein [Meiothermus sp.]
MANSVWRFTRLLVLVAAIGLGSALAQARVVNVICSVTQNWCEALGPAFKQATGIDVRIVSVSTNEALARLRAEQANPTFDVWFGGTGDPHYEAFKDAITEWYRVRAYNDLSANMKAAIGTTYIPLYQGILGFGVNPKVLQERGAPMPKCWRDLSNQAYRGLIQVANPNTSGTAYTMIATLVQLFGEDEAFTLMRNFHRNVAEYTRSGVAPRIALGRGEIGIGIQFMHDLVEFKKQGFPIEIVAPCEGTGYEIGGISLVRGAKNKANGQAFMEWAVSPAGQAVGFRAGIFSLPSNTKTTLVEGVPDPKDFKLINYDAKKFGDPDLRTRLITKWTREIFPLPRR